MVELFKNAFISIDLFHTKVKLSLIQINLQLVNSIYP